MDIKLLVHSTGTIKIGI